jgi:hypothetical protein
MQAIASYIISSSTFDVWALTEVFTLGVFFNERVIEDPFFYLRYLVGAVLDVFLGVFSGVILLVNILQLLFSLLRLVDQSVYVFIIIFFILIGATPDSFPVSHLLMPIRSRIRSVFDVKAGLRSKLDLSIKVVILKVDDLVIRPDLTDFHMLLVTIRSHLRSPIGAVTCGTLFLLISKRFGGQTAFDSFLCHLLPLSSEGQLTGKRSCQSLIHVLGCPSHGPRVRGGKHLIVLLLRKFGALFKIFQLFSLFPSSFSFTLIDIELLQSLFEELFITFTGVCFVLEHHLPLEGSHFLTDFIGFGVDV